MTTNLVHELDNEPSSQHALYVDIQEFTRLIYKSIDPYHCTLVQRNLPGTGFSYGTVRSKQSKRILS